jgi:hypothetical protein
MNSRRTAQLAMVLSLLAVGCSHQTTIDGWPALQHEIDTVPRSKPARDASHLAGKPGDPPVNTMTQAARTELLWPFGDVQHAEEFSQYGLRPLVNYRVEPGREWSEWQGLWPIVWVRRRPDDANAHVWPLYYNNVKRWPDRRKHDWAFFPFFLGGTDTREGPYFAFFPFAGLVKGKFGRDRIRFLLFPLYSDSTMSNGRKAWNVLFPFGAVTKSPLSESARIWPLYSRYKKVGEAPEYTVLWPFVHFTGRAAGGEKPRSRFFLFPLFGWDNTYPARQESIAPPAPAKTKSFTVLWPFFSFAKQEGGRWQWIGPWPIFRAAEGKERTSWQFWPFAARREGPETKGGYVLWPLYLYSVSDTKAVHFEENRSWPLYRDQRRLDKASNIRTRWRILWPLYHYHRQEDGHADFSALSPFWYADPDGYDRNYSVFFTVFQVTSDADGRRSVRLLWRLLRYDWGHDGRRVQLGPLASYRREPTGWRASTLFGLFEYGRIGGRGHVRLFFLPLTGRVAPAAER